jgi:hypothetical protein
MGDRESLLVWADALLEAEAPAGERILEFHRSPHLELSPRARSALTASFGSCPLRLTGGLVTEIDVRRSPLPSIECTRYEPLLTAWVDAFENEASARVAQWLVEARPFGLAIERTLPDASWQRLKTALQSFEIKHLTLVGEALLKQCEPLLFEARPSLSSLALFNVQWPEQWKHYTVWSGVKKLILRECKQVPYELLVKLPALQSIECIGATLSRAEHEALMHFEGEVVHEQFPRTQAPRRQLVFQSSFETPWQVLGGEGELKGFVADAAVWKRGYSDTTLFNVRAPRAHALRGELQLVEFKAQGEEVLQTLTHPPRAISASSTGELALLFEKKCTLLRANRNIYFEATQAVFSDDGEQLALLTDDGALRLFDAVTGAALTQWCPPFRFDTVHAVSTGFVCWSGSDAFLLTVGAAQPQLVFSRPGLMCLKGVAGGAFLAALFSPWALTVSRLDGSVVHEAAWSDTFDLPQAEALTVSDISISSTGVLSVALSSGVLTMIDCETGLTRTASAFPDDPPRRWTYLMNRQLHTVALGRRV